MRTEAGKLDITLPKAGHYGVGVIFLPRDPALQEKIQEIVEETTALEGQRFLGWRDVPVDNSDFSEALKETEPCIRQFFVGRGAAVLDDDMFERKLYILRKVVSSAV